MKKNMTLRELKVAEGRGQLWVVTMGSAKGKVSVPVIAANGLSASVEVMRRHSADPGPLFSCITTALKETAEKVFKEFQVYSQGTSADPIEVLLAEEDISLNKKAAMAY